MATAKAPEDVVAYDAQPKAQAPRAEPTGYSTGTLILAVVLTFIFSCAVAGIAVGISIHFSERAKDTQTTTTKTLLLPFWPAEPAESGDAIWGYEVESADGPEHWGTIRKLSDNSIAYPACAGLSQSPIDIVEEGGILPVVPLITNYTANVDFQIVARPGGHPGFQLKSAFGAPGMGTFKVDGATHSLLQFHYHAPSEHVIDGFRFPLEVHFVHQKIGSTGNDDLAVFGILYNISEDGTHNTVLDKFWWEIHHAQPHISGASVAAMMAQTESTYSRYSGSLTTPPCSETVKWHVTQSTVGINVMQATLFTYALSGVNNNRDAQPLYGRSVHSYAKV